MRTFTIKQAAEVLQFSERATIDLARKGKIPAAKIGHEWRIEEGALMALLRLGSQPPRQEEARG
jgi:excisionase family DNA binding protein